MAQEQIVDLKAELKQSSSAEFMINRSIQNFIPFLAWHLFLLKIKEYQSKGGSVNPQDPMLWSLRGQTLPSPPTSSACLSSVEKLKLPRSSSSSKEQI